MDTAVLDAGKSLVTTLNLKSGKYAFICFIQDRAAGRPTRPRAGSKRSRSPSDYLVLDRPAPGYPVCSELLQEADIVG